MSTNKSVVERYLDGFRWGDHDLILACLSADIEWSMPGFFHLTGKVAFAGEIENDAVSGRPVIEIVRMVEEQQVDVAEGAVHCKRRDGGDFHAVFCDVFELEQGRIRRLTTYLTEIAPPAVSC